MADARRPDGRGSDPVGAVPAGGELPVRIGRPPAYLHAGFDAAAFV